MKSSEKEFDEIAAFRRFADTLPIIVWQQASDGTLCYVNDAWHDVTRLPRTSSSYERSVETRRSSR